ncbi:MAG: hypothetical protein C5S40_00685 [ANME-2 cluster archaeon]|nr:hypothetical protein [ANME-2 cluster archaeon]
MIVEQTDNGVVINLESCDFMLDSGKPMVPEYRFFVAVPEGSSVSNVIIAEREVSQLEDNLVIAHYVPRTMDGVESSVEPDYTVYSSSKQFPQSSFEINGPDKLRHLNALEIVIYPVQARPALKQIEVLDVLRLTVELESLSGASLTLPSVPADDSLGQALGSLVVNPQDVIYASPADTYLPTPFAPSNILHTLAFKSPASLIHATKDTNTGNPGGVSLLQEDDGQYYNAEAGKTLYVDGFDIGVADPTAVLVHAVLQVEYVGPYGYNGSSFMRWAMEGDLLEDSTVNPTNLSGNESGRLTYDLLEHVGSPVHVNDLLDLDIEFSENGIGSGSKDIPFDYIWIEFAYREELTGGSDYLIITNMETADELAPLAQWKTERLGIDTQMYDMDWIDANWDGINRKERLKDFIVSMYENYSIGWVLLCGDDYLTNIPTDSSSYDNYYADVVGYSYPDICLGRLPSSKEFEMEGMVADIIAHQRDMRPWKENMYLIGTNALSTGDGRSTMLNIKNNYMVDHGLTFYEDYEVEGNCTTQRTIDRYNQGMGASSYYGHGSSMDWYYDNGSKLLIWKGNLTTDLNNSEKQGFVWTLSCSTGMFIGSMTSIGEEWVVTRNGGGIGYIGGTDLVEYSAGMELHNGFWQAYDDILDSGGIPTQGGTHMQSMNTDYYRVYNLFGDPQVGLTLTDPKVGITTGQFTPGYVEQNGFDQGEQITFNNSIEFPFTILPEGVHLNLTAHNEGGTTYYMDEAYMADPAGLDNTIFLNWTVPLTAAAGLYNVTARLYNATQGWEFVYENATYLFVDYKASVLSVEQVNAEVIEGDTVIYQVHIDNFVEPIPAGKVWVHLEGRDYDPYMTPFTFNSTNITTIPTGLDNIIEVEVVVTQPGTYNVTAGLDIDWAPMDSAAGNRTEVRGIRILDVTLNYPVFFRKDTANVTYSYFAFSDFTGNVSLFIDKQTDQLYDPVDFYNGTGTFNFTWLLSDDLENGTYDMELEVGGLARNLELKIDPMRVVSIREILDKGESWLIPKQQADNGWQDRNETGSNSNRNDTSLAMQALIWSGMDPSDPVIQQAANYVNDTLNISSPGDIEDLSENIWALSDAGRGSTQKVIDAAVDVRKMQNWVYEPETWALWFFTDMNDKWLVNVTGYDDGGIPISWEEQNGTNGMEWIPSWLNFTVMPGTVKLNITINTTSFFIMERNYYPPFVKQEPWAGLWVNDYEGPGDGVLWNYSVSEEVEFDRGWGHIKGEDSLAKYTAWGVIGLYQAGVSGSFESESQATGVQWLLDNQNLNGSWEPEYWSHVDRIDYTAIPLIALAMNGTSGQSIDNAVSWLKTKQIQDGSYPCNQLSWGYRDNVESTSHTLRALKRAGYVFDDAPYIREAVRWLCVAQNESTGGWDEDYHYMFTVTESMLALSALTQTYSIELTPGWNLISLPLVQANTSVQAVLSSIDGSWDVVKYYDTADPADPWKTYRPGASTNDLVNIDNTMGFWLHVTTGTNLTSYGQCPSDESISLKVGWNLVGYPTQNSRLASAALAGTGADIISIYNGTASYLIEDKTDLSTVTMRPGEGYWVHVPADTMWTVDW